MTEQELLEKLRDNPSAGLEAILTRYAGLVYTIVRGKLAQVCAEEDIEECAADVFAVLCRQADAVDLEKGTLKAYLATVARRTAIDRFRKTAVRVRPVSLDDDGLFPKDVGGTEDPAAAAISTETRRAVLDAVKSLGEPDTGIIIRKYFYGETAGQIAREVNLSPGAVRKRIGRSLARLRKCLGSDFYG